MGHRPGKPTGKRVSVPHGGVDTFSLCGAGGQVPGTPTLTAAAGQQSLPRTPQWGLAAALWCMQACLYEAGLWLSLPCSLGHFRATVTRTKATKTCRPLPGAQRSCILLLTSPHGAGRTWRPGGPGGLAGSTVSWLPERGGGHLRVWDWGLCGRPVPPSTRSGYVRRVEAFLPPTSDGPGPCPAALLSVRLPIRPVSQARGASVAPTHPAFPRVPCPCCPAPLLGGRGQ